MPVQSAHQKLDRLRNVLGQMDSVLVAYSGGIDSTVVLKIAHEQLGERAVGVTAVSPTFPSIELETATRVAAGSPQGGSSAQVKSETPFLVARIVRGGETSLFATGVYRDRFAGGADGRLLLAERIVVCDSQRFDTLLAIPL